MAKPGDTLQYRVVPMVGPDKRNLVPDNSRASEWTAKRKLSARVANGVEAYCNRGIVAAQSVSRRLGITPTNLQTRKLEKVISTPGNTFRNYLAGPLGARLFEVLKEAVHSFPTRRSSDHRKSVV